jgi:hypothetical protein
MEVNLWLLDDEEPIHRCPEALNENRKGLTDSETHVSKIRPTSRVDVFQTKLV